MKTLSSTAAPHILKSQAGVSLVSTLIGLGVTLITVTVAISGYNNVMYARKMVAAGMAVHEVDTVFTNAALSGVSQFITSSNCTDPSVLDTINTGGIGQLSYNRNIDPSAYTGTNVPKDITDGIARCASKPFVAAVPANTTAVYTCFDFYPNAKVKASSAKDAFVASKAAFLELYTVIRDFQTEQPITCGAATSGNPKPGLVGYYSLHWVMNSVNGPVFKSKSGVLYRDL